jgi:hypothetical protein
MVRITKILSFVVLISVVLSASVAAVPVLAQASRADEVHLMVVELRVDGKPAPVSQIPPTDDSMTNPDYGLLSFHWYTTANYWINPSNNYGFSAGNVVANITTSAGTWDSQTSAAVFSYQGTTTRSAGKRDGYNVVSWGRYRAGVIAVTYIWYRGSNILETDTTMNKYYAWSLTGEAGKMDVQNIMTHELGHWAGLDDLYNNADYWLTMYGYATYGETYKRTLGLGDILGLQAVYGK